MRDKIRAWLISEVIGQDAAGELRDDTVLLESGVLDSISLLRFIRFLEEECGVDVPVTGALSLDSFRSIDAIVAYAESLPAAAVA